MSVDGYRKGKSRRERAKLKLHRGIDGRIKHSSKNEEADIGDVWAQQERIRLAEALQEDQKRRERERLKKERGLVGVAKNDIGSLKTKVASGLFGEQATNKPSASHRLKRASAAKTAEIHALLTEVKKPKKEKSGKFKQGLRKARAFLWPVVGIVVILALVYLIFHLTYDHFHHSDTNYAAHGTDHSKINVQNKPNTPNDNTPKFAYLLPKGKTIGDFGGWHGSNIPTVGTMYNYSDTLGGNTVVVAQQGLQSQGLSNPQAIALQVAKHFSANRTVTALDLTPIYLSAANKSFQSAVFVKDNVLVLMGAQGQVPDATWLSYINSLQPSQ